jgi:hypothetical protein
MSRNFKEGDVVFDVFYKKPRKALVRSREYPDGTVFIQYLNTNENCLQSVRYLKGATLFRRLFYFVFRPS